MNEKLGRFRSKVSAVHARSELPWPFAISPALPSDDQPAMVRAQGQSYKYEGGRKRRLFGESQPTHSGDGALTRLRVCGSCLFVLAAARSRVVGVRHADILVRGRSKQQRGRRGARVGARDGSGSVLGAAVSLSAALPRRCSLRCWQPCAFHLRIRPRHGARECEWRKQQSGV